MQSVSAFRAFNRHAGADNFGEAVNVEGRDIEPFFYLLAHALAPGFGAEDAHAKLQTLHVHAHFFALLGEIEGVGGSTADCRGAEILQQHDLFLRTAARHGNHACTQPFGAVMGAQAAGEEAVSVGIVNNVVLRQSSRHKGACHEP